MHRLPLLSIRSKIFAAMCMSSTLIVVIIFFVLNLVFFYFSISTQVSTSLKELSYINTQLDFFINSATNYSRTIVSDPLIHDYATHYKKTAAISTPLVQTHIKDEIAHTIQNTKYIHSVSLYDTDFDFLVSSEIYPTPMDGSSLKGLEEKTWLLTQKKAKTNNQPIYTLSCFSPFYSYSTAEHLGYIEMTLLESSIRDIYTLPHLHANETFLIDTGGSILSSNSDSYSIKNTYPYFNKLIAAREKTYFITSKDTVFFNYNQYLNAYIVTHIPLVTILNPLYALTLVCISFSIFCVFLYIPIASRLARTITHPIAQLIQHTQTIKDGCWQPTTIVQTDTDISMLAESFNSMVLAQEELKNQLLFAQKEQDKLTLNLLQEQINPHFLYNTLDNICSLAEIGELELLNQLIFNLSTFYRKGLSSGQAYITIREELEMVRSYMHILQIRYYNKFDFTISCPDELLSQRCLKFLLQPIVENSIYHGIKPLETKGHIHITVSRESDGSITFSITDNGIGISSDALSKIWASENKHFGLRNIHYRIQLHYGTQYGLTLEKHLPTGCLATLKIHSNGGPYHET
ncbi:MAG: histidine kinase [Cellulosilyticaceae bacterium]